MSMDLQSILLRCPLSPKCSLYSKQLQSQPQYQQADTEILGKGKRAKIAKNIFEKEQC